MNLNAAIHVWSLKPWRRVRLSWCRWGWPATVGNPREKTAVTAAIAAIDPLSRFVTW